MTTQLKLHRVFLFALIFILTFISVTAQVSTRVNSNGTTSLRIKDANGLRYWSAFDHNDSGKKIDGDNPTGCPTDYTKDPTANLKGGMKYWLRYRDCTPGAGTKKEFELFFDKTQLDTWVDSPEATIPPPKTNKQWVYWGIPALFILIVGFLVMRRKRPQ